jgi:hypothetical protein
MIFRGEYLHFRCSWHAVDGHFHVSQEYMAHKCQAPGCENQGRAYWYRGAQFATLPASPAKFEYVYTP